MISYTNKFYSVHVFPQMVSLPSCKEFLFIYSIELHFTVL